MSWGTNVSEPLGTTGRLLLSQERLSMQVVSHHGKRVCRPPRCDGFHLIEIVLVLVLIATLTAIAAPRYSGAVARYRASAAAQRIVADIALARSEARTKSATQTVEFDVANDSYLLVNVTALSNLTAAYVTELTESPYQADLISADFGGASTLTFDGYGRPVSGGVIVVRVGPNDRTISVDSESGKATVQ